MYQIYGETEILIFVLNNTIFGVISMDMNVYNVPSPLVKVFITVFDTPGMVSVGITTGAMLYPKLLGNLMFPGL